MNKILIEEIKKNLIRYSKTNKIDKSVLISQELYSGSGKAFCEELKKYGLKAYNNYTVKVTL